MVSQEIVIGDSPIEVIISLEKEYGNLGDGWILYLDGDGYPLGQPEEASTMQVAELAMAVIEQSRVLDKFIPDLDQSSFGIV
jgi:hypothetical protein